MPLLNRPCRLLAAFLVFMLHLQAQSVTYRVPGLNFSPYVDGQNPNVNAAVTLSQIQQRLQIVAPYTQWVRSYSSINGLENVPAVAKSMGLNVAAGAWISGNLAANSAEVNGLIAVAQTGNVDIAIVGTEALLRGDVTESQLLAYLQQVRQAVPPSVKVTTADTHDVLLLHPNVIAAVDVVLPNIYPYWEGVSISNAICSTVASYQSVVAASGGKPVFISEVGWPSDGNAFQSAVPSPANAAQYFNQFASWAHANSVPYLYFDALDESWKALYEGPQGAHWGVWDKTGVLKSGMQPVFDGQTVSVDCNAFPGGSGTPSLAFTYVPPYGKSENVEGQALHISTSNYRVVFYIKVGGGWWVKPTLAAPLTTIQSDGSWSAPYNTGGSDPIATEFMAYLIPIGYNPPLLRGAASLPSELDTNSVAHANAIRTPNSISGVITDAANHPIAGVLLALSGPDALTTTTVPDGKYSFPALTGTGPYTVTPSLPGDVFTPISQTFAAVSGNQIANFVSSSTADISIQGNAPASSIAGSNMTATFIVTNDGPASASHVTANVTLPPSFVLSSVNTTRGACDAALQCDLGAMPRSAYATITVVATPSSPGNFSIQAGTSNPEPDPNSLNNTVTLPVAVSAASLSITKTHSGSPYRGQASMSYTVIVRNAAGVGATAGTVTVTENPPAGLTLLSMLGTGWTCPSGGNTCSRSDSLASGANYPAIVIKAGVKRDASSPQVNSVTVCGGGSNCATATDSTTVLIPAVSLTPSAIDFGGEPVASSTPAQSITITNTGNGLLLISSAVLTGANPGDFTKTQTCASSLAAGASCTYSIAFKPTAVGARSAVLTLTDTADGSPQTVSLTGTGVGVPKISFSPTSLSFANVTVGTSSAAKKITLSNPGTATLNISAFGIAGANAGDYVISTNTCGPTLTTAATCAVSIVFTPGASGPSSGTLTVTDDAAASPQPVALSGAGVLTPKVMLNPTSLSFGNQTQGTVSVPKMVTVTNIGNGVLNISSIALAGTNAAEFAQSNTCGPPVAPGGSCTLNVVFQPVSTGSKSAALSITDDAAGSPQKITLTGAGLGIPTVALNPVTLNFASQPVSSPTAPQTITLTNTGNGPLSISSASLGGANPGDFSKTATCGTSLAAGASCAYSITFKPTAVGARSATLSIADNASGSPQSVPLSGNGLGVAKIALSPTSLAFGNITVGTTSAAKKVTVSNPGTATLNLGGVALAGANAADFTISANTCGGTLAVGLTCAVSVVFHPTSTVTSSAALSFTDDAAASPQSVLLGGTGVLTPKVTLSPTSLSFGNQLHGTVSSQKTVTLTNSGNGTLNLSFITLTGTNPTDFGESTTCGTTVAPGATCTISVAFQPATTGAKSAAVSIADNAAGSPQQVTLSGTGQ